MAARGRLPARALIALLLLPSAVCWGRCEGWCNQWTVSVANLAKAVAHTEGQCARRTILRMRMRDRPPCLTAHARPFPAL